MRPACAWRPGRQGSGTWGMQRQATLSVLLAGDRPTRRDRPGSLQLPPAIPDPANRLGVQTGRQPITARIAGAGDLGASTSARRRRTEGAGREPEEDFEVWLRLTAWNSRVEAEAQAEGGQGATATAQGLQAVLERGGHPPESSREPARTPRRERGWAWRPVTTGQQRPQKPGEVPQAGPPPAAAQVRGLGQTEHLGFLTSL